MIDINDERFIERNASGKAIRWFIECPDCDGTESSCYCKGTGRILETTYIIRLMEKAMMEDSINTRQHLIWGFSSGSLEKAAEMYIWSLEKNCEGNPKGQYDKSYNFAKMWIKIFLKDVDTVSYLINKECEDSYPGMNTSSSWKVDLGLKYIREIEK